MTQTPHQKDTGRKAELEKLRKGGRMILERWGGEKWEKGFCTMAVR